MEEPARKVDIRIIMSMTGSAVTVTENMALEDNIIRIEATKIQKI